MTYTMAPFWSCLMGGRSSGGPLQHWRVFARAAVPQRHHWWYPACVALLVALVVPAPWALAAGDRGPSVVEEVVVEGGVSITSETVEYYLGVSPGDPFDEEAVAKNFTKFWESGLVEDLKVETEEVGPGKVRLIVTIKERPKVTEYLFVGNKKLSTSTIREKLDEQNVSLYRNVPLREAELRRIRRAIAEVYAKEGYASAVVEAVVEEAGPNARKVTFKIDEGAKVRISRIRFEGNQVYSDARLKLTLKKTKEREWYRPFGKKIIWSKEAWGEDSENLKKFYMNRGYKDVVVGEPTVKLVARHPEAPTQKKKKISSEVTIPVEEGRRFRLASVRVSGNRVFTEEQLLPLFEVKPGRIYNYSQIEAGAEAIRTRYHSQGYIYAYTSQRPIEHPDERDLVDVVVDIYEGDRFRLGRLEFAGNTKTQEKVIRREFRLVEGDWMNLSLFRTSVFKVNQLGYFKLTEDPVEFSFDQDRKLVNVVVKGQEVGRTDIQFGAGYSELDGFFAQFMFNTRNFLGRGETLGVSVSSGRRADSYAVSFSEPYFLDRRMMIGGSLYHQTYELVDFQREAKGGSAMWGMGLGIFGNFTLGYSYEDVYAKYTVTRYVAAGDEPKNPHRRPVPPPYRDTPLPDRYFDTYTGVTSSLTPGYFYDSRDDPFDPNQGASLYSRLRFAGGPLGGDFDYLRPEFGVSLFHPLRRRYILAGNLEAGYIRPFGGTEIPVYDRYRLGGERTLRGFPYYSVLPRKANGDYFYTAGGARIAGDRFLQLNLEFQIKVGGPVKFILFTDIGNTWHEQQGWDLRLLRYSAGAEMRIFLPVFQAPLRFIYGINLDPFPDEKRSDFQFSIGTTF